MAALGAAALLILGVWLFGGFLARMVGATLIVVGLVALTVLGDPDGAVVLAAGAGLWFAGQLLFAARHGWFRSPTAERVWKAPRRRTGD